MVFANPGSKLLSVNMVTSNVFLGILFVSGAWAICLRRSYLSITTPKTMEALSGSCLLIPCNFNAENGETFDSTRTTYGVWIKNDSRFGSNRHNVIFNSSGTVMTYRMSLTGDLKQKNCTTLFSRLFILYTDTYFFRIENRPFVATASCDPLQITVRYSPWRPSIEISGDLKEKQSVTITCSAFTPCPYSPPQLTWNLQQIPQNSVEENTDGTFTTKIQKIITLSEEHDGSNITCSARYPVDEGKAVKTAEERTTLSVSYAPKNTLVSISPSGLVSAGSQVTLTCSSRANPSVSFTWFKISKGGDVSVSEGDFYSVKVTNVTDDVYYCLATNALGQQTSMKIHVTNEGAKHLDSSSPWGAVLGAIFGIIVLICAVAAVWWFKLKHPTSQQTRSLTADEADRATETGDIHYGEINFSMRGPGPSSASEQDGGQQQETLYAQVKVSQTANGFRQSGDGPEEFYAQVKRK